VPDYRDSLPADDEAVEALEHWRIQTGQDSGIVFTGRNDGRLNKARKSSRNPLQDAEIKNFPGIMFSITLPAICSWQALV
jgi:integrase